MAEVLKISDRIITSEEIVPLLASYQLLPQLLRDIVIDRFRIREGEQSFALLAREYSQGPEAQTGGLIGPVELATLHPTLAKVLTVSQPEQLWAPIQLGQWWVLIRLEKFIPVQLDEPMRQQLLDELFQNWLQEQLENLGTLITTETQDSAFKTLLGIGQ